jgi:hypothetical protein
MSKFIERAFKPTIIKESFSLWECPCGSTIHPYREENALVVIRTWYQCVECKEYYQYEDLKKFKKVKECEK